MTEIEARERQVKAIKSLDYILEYRTLFNSLPNLAELDTDFIAEYSYDIQSTLEEYIESLDTEISNGRAA